MKHFFGPPVTKSCGLLLTKDLLRKRPDPYPTQFIIIRQRSITRLNVTIFDGVSAFVQQSDSIIEAS